jgi:hypothetical protein
MGEKIVFKKAQTEWVSGDLYHGFQLTLWIRSYAREQKQLKKADS